MSSEKICQFLRLESWKYGIEQYTTNYKGTRYEGKNFTGEQFQKLSGYKNVLNYSEGKVYAGDLSCREV